MMNFRLITVIKNLGRMLAVGLLIWVFAYLGIAQGLGYFPTIAAFMVTIWVKYRQWSLDKHRIMTVKTRQRRILNSFVDILAGNLGFWIGYNLMLKLTVGSWIV